MQVTFSATSPMGNDVLSTVCRNIFGNPLAKLPGLWDSSYVTLAGGSLELFDLREALTHAFQTKTSSVESKPASMERSSKGLFAFKTGKSSGGLSSVNSEPSKKRYWWERVCNTAQADGEESVSDPNGFRVSNVLIGLWLKVFLIHLGKAECRPEPLGL